MSKQKITQEEFNQLVKTIQQHIIKDIEKFDSESSDGEEVVRTKTNEELETFSEQILKKSLIKYFQIRYDIVES